MSLTCSSYKSSQTAYNNSSQAFAEDGITLEILGNLATNTGCSITTQNSGFRINNNGLYRISYDVIFSADKITTTTTETKAKKEGVATLQLFKDTVALPCAIASVTANSEETRSLHIETILFVPVCCMNNPVFSAQINGITGEVSHVCATALKLA